MAVPRRAFALMLVLVAVGATFALAVQGSAALRTATAEAAAMRRARIAERFEVSAATVVLAALTAGGERRVEPGGAAAPAPPVPAPAPEGGIPDMPPEMKDHLRGLARDGADASPDAPASGGAQATRETGGPYTALRARGLPAGAMTVRLDGAEARVRVIDAGGLVNVNRAPRDGLARFFEARGLSSADAAALADQIADWRDEDSVPREFGAERDDYRARGVQIRNGPIRTLEELLYLPAMTRERFDLVREDLTLVGDGRVTATTAPRAVLLSVPGMTPDAADAILSARRAGALRTLADLDEAVDRFTAGAVETGLRLDPTSHLRLLVTLAGGGPTLAVEALVSDDRGVRILGWGPAGPGAAGLP